MGHTWYQSLEGYRMGAQLANRAASGTPFGQSSRGGLYSIPQSLLGTAQEHGIHSVYKSYVS